MGITFHLDAIAQEGNETAILKLVPLQGDLEDHFDPSVQEGVFFEDELLLEIIDKDCMCVWEGTCVDADVCVWEGTSVDADVCVWEGTYVDADVCVWEGTYVDADVCVWESTYVDADVCVWEGTSVDADVCVWEGTCVDADVCGRVQVWMLTCVCGRVHMWMLTCVCGRVQVWMLTCVCIGMFFKCIYLITDVTLSLTNDDYRATEADQFMPVKVMRQGFIGTPVTVLITPMTLSQHRATGRPDPHRVPYNDPLSPTEAGKLNSMQYRGCSRLAIPPPPEIDNDVC